MLQISRVGKYALFQEGEETNIGASEEIYYHGNLDMYVQVSHLAILSNSIACKHILLYFVQMQGNR